MNAAPEPEPKFTARVHRDVALHDRHSAHDWWETNIDTHGNLTIRAEDNTSDGAAIEEHTYAAGHWRSVHIEPALDDSDAQP